MQGLVLTVPVGGLVAQPKPFIADEPIGTSAAMLLVHPVTQQCL